jgi:hypothetical protein
MANLLDYILNSFFKSSEEKQFENLLKDANIELDSEVSTILKSYMEKAGMPYIKSSENVWPTFKKGKRAKGEPDTLNVRHGNISDFVEELSHAIQYNPRKKSGEYRDNISTVRDSIRYEAINQMKKHGKDRYDIPGTVEYEAHKKIAPEIWKELWALGYPTPIDAYENIKNLNK